MNNINYQKLESALSKAGYSDEKIEKFRQKFFELLFQKVGNKILTPLKQEQREELATLLVSDGTNEEKINEFLQKNNLSGLENAIQSSFDELVLSTLEKILRLSPKAKRETIINMLSS